MASIAQQISTAQAALRPVAGELAALEARLLAAHAWGMSRESLLRDGDCPADAGKLEPLLARRLAHEPIAQIVGGRDFWKDRFAVSSAVLTPRPDSETMIETLLRLRPNRLAAYRLLDLGTGSGCLLLSALGEYAHACGVGVDRSAGALEVAQRNAAALHRAGRAVFLCSDWCSNLGEERFDIVLANPPYIPTAAIAGLDAEVRDYEPHGALDGGADGLEDYRRILQQLAMHVNDGALVLLEVGQGQAEAVVALAAEHFHIIDIVPDLAGIPRIVVLTIREAATAPSSINPA